jgi:hypothetical protein
MQNSHSGQFEMKLKFFFVSESVSVPLNKELIQKIFLRPFSANFNLSHKFFRQPLIFPHPLLSFLVEITAT